MRSATRLEILGAGILVAALVMIMAAHSFAATTVKRTQHEILVNEIPVLYIAGTVEGGKVFKYHGDTITNLTIQPLGTSQIWERSLTFCGDISSKIQGVGPVAVFSYKRVQSRSMCYDFLSVYGIAAD